MSEYAGRQAPKETDISTLNHEGTLLDGLYDDLSDQVEDQATVDLSGSPEELDQASEFMRDIAARRAELKQLGCSEERIKFITNREFGPRMVRLALNKVDTINVFLDNMPAAGSEESTESTGRTRELRDWAERAAGDDSWD